ncbi:class I SAM-dependent methyltransferase [Ramlibacter rhizophilus]|uniref:Methyltransferase domain-containing protein n=1 Tax=Ramlibacter rhizophilus TaxID=1781167 RepID=A0A4Z0BXP9_9BURK|nr:hypothetical protein [Ramlibacter rhizophilus]TFZ03294.1 hypothetical protein EZ242_05240 [Ramlibacter rhizophilus]
MLNGRSHPNRFFRGFVGNPRSVGAVLPASSSLSRAVAAATAACAGPTDPEPCPLVELGAGTGALTESIRGMRPVLVERDEAFAAVLHKRFPELEIRIQCATDALRNLQEPVGVVSSIPLLNNPQSAELKRTLEQCFAEGRVRFLVLYSYGLADPCGETSLPRGRRAARVWRSMPPASVWVYQPACAMARGAPIHCSPSPSA